MKRAYSYLRMSTETQSKGDSRRRQIELGREYARKHGYELIESYEDIGVSAFRGKNLKIGALQKFMASVQEGEIEVGSVLLIEAFDRISRDSVLKSISLLTQLLSAGIEVVTLSDGQHYTYESWNENPSQIYVSIGGMFRANEESVIKSKRVRAAWSQKRRSANTTIMTRRAPEWIAFDEGGKKFVLNDRKADIVRDIFQMYLSGLGVFAITKQLNANIEKFPPIARAGHWNKSYVTKILNNISTYGAMQPNRIEGNKRVPEGDVITGYYPSVIDQSTFDRVQHEMKQRLNDGAGRKGKGFRNIFTKLAKCGGCGGTMVFRDKGRPPKGGQYLICQTAYQGAGCNARHWEYKDFEGTFFDFVSELSLQDVVEGEADAQRKAARNNAEAEIAYMSMEIDKLSEEIEIYIDRLGQLDAANIPLINERLLRLQGERDALQEATQIKRNELSGPAYSDLLASREEALQKFRELSKGGEVEAAYVTRAKAHRYISQLVERIEVYTDFDIEPFEAPEIVSTRLLERIAKSGIAEAQEIEEFFSTDYGRRLYRESERYFVVRFHSGRVRTVMPGQIGSLVSDASELAKKFRGSKEAS